MLMTATKKEREQNMERTTEEWTGPVTRQGLESGVRAVVVQEDALNHMNVFPIPDRDTGTNLRRTLEASLAGIDGEATASGQVFQQFARSGLIHSRGNSGAIFAEILRGFADASRDQTTLDPSSIRVALGLAADYAYRAVSEPAEGTILTAVRAAAAAVEAVDQAARLTVRASWALAASAAHQATAEGPRWLPILAEHGVVDAAALGFSHFLQGMAEMRDRWTSTPTEYGYEVQYVLMSSGDRSVIQSALGPLGNSLVVSGGSGMYRIHIHTQNPTQVLEHGRRLGAVERVTVENLDHRNGEPESAYPMEDHRI